MSNKKIYNVKDCIFALDHLKVFRLILVGKIDARLGVPISEFINDELGNDLEFNIPDNVVEYGLYKGDLQLTYTKDNYTDECDLGIDIIESNLTKIKLSL